MAGFGRVGGAVDRQMRRWGRNCEICREGKEERKVVLGSQSLRVRRR